MSKGEIPIMFSNSECEEQEDEQLKAAVPRGKAPSGDLVVLYNGFWCRERLLQPIITFQRNYQAIEEDILLSSMPKSGTTWLKALIFSITHRHLYMVDQSPLKYSNPHELVPFDFELCSREYDGFRKHGHRLVFTSHLPYHALPHSIIDSKCKIVYICRNPMDWFISRWYFQQEIQQDKTKAIPLAESFEAHLLDGRTCFGPFWDHVLGYWNASLKAPEKVLFLKYEDLKKDIITEVKKIAEFLALPFSKEEENNGLIEDITKLCSFESLKNMEVNKSGKLHTHFAINKSSFFRKGEVGDWVNYLTPTMVDRLERLMKEKLGESGLNFEFNAGPSRSAAD